MSAQALLILLLWLPICVLLIGLMAPLRAVVWGYLLAMLLLPTGGVHVPGLPDIDKWQMTGLGLTIGAAAFHWVWITRLRLTLADWLLLGFIVSTGATSITNDLGIYDAFSSMLHMYLRFGAPYLLLRVFCRNGQEVVYTISAIIAAAALYALPAIWEFRMSPQMHRTLYGYSDQGWQEHYRHGFYRPCLFFEHGIPLAFFFATATIMSGYLYLRGVLRPIWRIPSIALVGLTSLGTLLSMTYGAYCACAVALAAMVFSPSRRWRYCALIPMAAAVTWSIGRYADVVDVKPLIRAAYNICEIPRAQSFEYRLLADNALLARARKAPILGWGGWNRNRLGVTDQWGKPVAIDALWVDMTGKYGLLGVVLYYSWFAVAAVRGLRCLKQIPSPTLQAAVYALATMTGIELINWQLNGFVNPTVLLGTAMLTTVAQLSQTRSVPSARRATPVVRSPIAWTSPSRF